MDSGAGSVRVEVLRGIRVWRQGREMPLRGAGQRTLLAALAIAEGQPLSRRDLMEILWPAHAPPTAVNVMQSHVAQLRRVLEPGRSPRRPSAVLRTVGTGYALGVPPVSVDVVDFRQLVTAGRQAQLAGDHQTARTLLGRALALWHSSPLMEIPALAEHPRFAALVEERRTAAGWHADAAMATGHAADALHSVLELAVGNALDESAQARLMRAYRALGRRADAMEVYRRTRQRLADTLGVDPSAELDAAFHALLDAEGGE